MSEHDTPEEAIENQDFGTWSHPDKPSLKDPDPIVDRKMSRRDFGKLVGTFGAGIVGSLALGELGIDANEVGAQENDTEITDILTSEELESRYKTRIHDLSRNDFPNNYVELDLRESVGDERLFQRLESGRMAGLDIFLINGPDVDPRHFTPEQRAYLQQHHSTVIQGIERQMETVVEFNREEIETNREQAREEYNTRLEELNSRSPDISEDRYDVEKQALDYKYGRYLADEPTPDDLSAMRMRGYAPTLGGGEDGPHGFVFLAVRDEPQTITFTSGDETITIDSSRTLHGESQNLDYAPHPDQSYLNPEVRDEPNLGGYVAVSITPGLTLRHELAHTTGIFDETHADEHAIAGLLDAADHMAETGSDEKYWAVFTTPEGVTITENDDHANVT